MTGRVAVIVGASSGIGLATALQLAAAGDRLVLVARESGALDEAAERCRTAGATEVLCVPADARKKADMQSLVDQTMAAYGRIDVLVHTATVMAYGTIEQVPSEIFEIVVDTAIHGTAHIARAFLPVFRTQKQGTFIIVNSLVGSITVPNMGAYATAKWGQLAIARTLQQEVRDQPGVHVCVVSPGSTNTPIYRQAANYTGKAARPPFPVLQPERTAAAIVDLTGRPRNHVSIPVGPPNPIIIAGYRLLPPLFDALVGPLFKLAALTGTKQPATEGNVLAPAPAKERLHGLWPEK